MISTYEPSGTYESRLFAYAAAGLVASVGLGWLYQYLMGILPLILLSMALTLGYAAVLYLGVEYIVERGECRNRALAASVGLLIGVGGWFASFYFDYLEAVTYLAPMRFWGTPQAEAALEGFTFLFFIQQKAEAGWTISKLSSSSTPLEITGIFVYIGWAIEAAVIVGGAAWGGWSKAESPYCESCEGWTVEEPVLGYSMPDEAVIAEIAAAEDKSDLIEPPISIDPTQSKNLLYGVETCPDCDGSMYLNISQHDYGGDDEEVHEIWKAVEIDQADRNALGDLAMRLEQRLAEVFDDSPVPAPADVDGPSDGHSTEW